MPAMLAIAVMALVLMSGAARAMDVVPAGDQLILSGPVIGDDYRRVAALLASRPAIRTIILRDSPGGHAESGYRLGELFRTKGLDTAVSGFCYSSCSRMFLGGRERRFTDDFPAERTQVGFHGHYGRDGRLLVELIRRLGLKAWIIRHSDGKADAALVERWINLPRSAGLIHFFHPALARQHGAATFICQGDERSPAGVFGCEPIDRTALDLGVITSLDIVHGNDRQRPEPARQ